MRRIFLLSLIASTAPMAIGQWKPELDFRFRNGDSVEIGVYRGLREPQTVIHSTVRLDSAGMAALGNGRKAKVGFGNIVEATATIEEAFRSSDDMLGLSVNAHIHAINGQPIFTVLGEVRSKGHGPHRNGLTLEEAIKMAGGFGPGADLKRITIQRKGTVSLVDVRQPETARKQPVEAGDIIFVDLNPLRPSEPSPGEKVAESEQRPKT